jgi:exopolyphosphatase/guanosine-5'-triphosphate,3'-diphosphate pyrophosphatase
MRVAAIDLGTNTTRLLVADVDDFVVNHHKVRLTEVARRVVITRLGEGVDAHGELQAKPTARVLRVLDDYAAEARALGTERVLAVATSAVRDAGNGAKLLAEIERRYRFTARLLDGREEAETTFRGITSDRTLTPGTLVVDIGGGSTELIVGGPEGISFATSLQAGGVRLTERYLHGDPPLPAEIAAAAAHVRTLLPALDVAAAIGVAGTVITVAAIDLGLVEHDIERIHGHRVPRAVVERVTDELAALPLDERKRVPGLEPARAPVIVGGLVVLREVMTAYGLEEIEASERDILHGAALLAAEG